MLSNSLKLLIAGFAMGWGPCLAYAAPLLLPYIGATKRNWQDGLTRPLDKPKNKYIMCTIAIEN